MRRRREPCSEQVRAASFACIKYRTRDGYAFLQQGLVHPALHLDEAFLQQGLVQPALHLEADCPVVLEDLPQHLLLAHPIGPVSSATIQKTPNKATKTDRTRCFIEELLQKYQVLPLTERLHFVDRYGIVVYSVA